MLHCRTLFRWVNHKLENIQIKKIEKKIKSNINNDDSLVYDSIYQENKNFWNYDTDIKAVAFYLPQFHTFPENDEWWGEGFTEWTNTRKCKPRFKGHYQPRIPHKDIGYYDLSKKKAMEAQIKLALQHRLYGFCFYYYWFSGKKLMEKPLDLLMKNPEWKIHFCLCWANENFTRTWDGAQNDILMEQKYKEDDAEKFIQDIQKYMADERYIRVDNKPVILIYNLGTVPNPKKLLKEWRFFAKKEGIGDILIWACRTNGVNAKILGVQNEIDAEIEFPPHNMWWKTIMIENNRNDHPKIYNYKKLVEILLYKIKMEKNKKIYHTCMMGWDNSCRRKKEWTLYTGFSTEYFGKWISAIVDKVRKNEKSDRRFLFINAWNEWGEGTYLEPDQKYGYANINMLSEQICIEKNKKKG